MVSFNINARRKKTDKEEYKRDVIDEAHHSMVLHLIYFLLFHSQHSLN